jgi:hypothetical protein
MNGPTPMMSSLQESIPTRTRGAKVLRRIFLPVIAVAFASDTARAIMVDLTQPNSAGSVNTFYGTAYFSTDTTQPTGTGVFDPFLTIQRKGVEEGYNSSDKNAPFDVKRIPQWNHEFTVAEMKAGASIHLNDQDYFRFLIDINEPNAGEKALISLDSLKLFTSPIKGQTTHNVENLGVKRFDLDLSPANTAVDNWVLYDDRNHGSGQSDIAFLIPASAFAGALDTDFVYMYQQFGAHADADPIFENTTEGGFEETRFGGIPFIPEASTVAPLAGVLLMACSSECFRRRRRVTVLE